MTPDDMSREGSPLQEAQGATYHVVEAGGDGSYSLSQHPQILHRVTQLTSQDLRFSQSAPGSPAGKWMTGGWEGDVVHDWCYR